jgi:superfamily II DNA or RNA helicase
MARIDRSLLNPRQVDVIKQDLLLRQKGGEKYGFGPGQDVRLYREVANWIEVPRQYAVFELPSVIGKIDDATVEGEPLDITFTKPLREMQEPLVEDFLSKLGQGKHRYGGIFSAKCGTGKTVMALKFLEQIGRPAIVLVHANFLMAQWRQAIKMFTDIDSDEIGLIQQDKCEWKGKKIVLAMVESLVGEREYPQEMFEHFGVLIADEVHRHGAAQWSRAIAMFPARLRIGLSATPRRGDGLWDVLRWHVGDVLTESKKGGDANVYVVPTGIALDESTYRTRNAEINLGRLLTVLSKIGSRNDLITHHILKAVAAGRRVLVLSERLKHLDTLKAMVEFLWEGSPSALNIGRYVGGMKESEIEVSKTCNLLFGTVQYAKEGLDDPSLDTLFLTTPKSDVEQAVGRILRRDADKKPPFVIDFIDNKTGPCIGFYKRRRKQYEHLGFEVTELAAKS